MAAVVAIGPGACRVDSHYKAAGQGGYAGALSMAGAGATSSGGVAPAGGSTSGGAAPMPQAGQSTDAGGAGNAEGGDGGLGGQAAAGSAGNGMSPTVAITSPDDNCEGIELKPNNDRASSVPYKLGTAYTACLQNATDIDYYLFSVPADSRGGCVQVKVSDVGANGDIRATAWTSLDAGQIHVAYTRELGTGVGFYFTAKSGSSFHLSIARQAELKASNPYTLTAIYSQVPDIYEPNDTLAQAVPIAPNRPVRAYTFAGFELSNIPVADFLDWYKVDLGPGPVDISLSNLTEDALGGGVTLTDSSGALLATKASAGTSVALQANALTAGTYFVRVEPNGVRETSGTTVDLPQYVKQPYSLLVAQ
ncbi:MAG: PPC domain-containing protein [Myxococcota bacterium]